MSYARLWEMIDDTRAEAQTKQRPIREDHVPLVSHRCKRPHARRTFTLIQFAMNADEDTRATASSILWRLIHQEPDSETAFEHYLSFLAVMLPEIQNDIETCIRNLGHNLAYNEFPNHFVYQDCINDNRTISMDLEQSMVYLGVSLLVPFKNINAENYTGYFTRRIAALCNMVGGNLSKMGIPFSVDKCIFFKSKMNQFDPVRKAIVRFLISETTRSEVLMNVVSRYVLLMMAWAEMTGFFFVMEALVASISPVIFCTELAHEINKYFDIADRVFSTEHPSLYKFLAPEHEMIPVDESQFPILYAVSYEILAEQHSSIKQLYGPTNVNQTIVDKYLALHKAYVGSNMMMTKKVERFIPDIIDPE